MTEQTRARTRTPPPTVDAEEGTITVTRVAYNKEESEELGRIRVPVFKTDPARVRVAGGISRNLGDFNHARVDISIELPCYPEQSEIRRAYDYASELLDKLIPEQLEKASR